MWGKGGEGRLLNATDYTQKYPIVLPNKHHLMNLIIKKVYYKNLHAGPNDVGNDS